MTNNATENWAYSIMGTGIGISGLNVIDLDNDGALEIITGGSQSTFGSNDFWHILNHETETGSYEIQWTSQNYSAAISQISVLSDDQNESNHILVGLDNGEVFIYDGQTLEEIGHINSTDPVNQILLADIDDDSIDEIIIGHNNKLSVYSADSYDLEHEINYGASDFKVGNVDLDAANEIVLSNGLVLEFDGSQPTVDWEHSSEFGASIALSDIDDDGMEEIIGASSWSYITTYDADVKSPKGQITTSHDIAALLVTDVNQDGNDEIIYGDGQWGAIHAYNALTLAKEWEIDNPEHGITNLAVNDTDGDGDLEIVWGAGATSSGPDYLYVYDIETQVQEWQSQHIDGPFKAIDIGDVDSDGSQDILFASSSSDNGYDDGIVFSYDAPTHDLEWQSEQSAFGSNAWTGIHDLEIGDVDDDGIQDIVVATDQLYDGAIYIFDGISKDLKQSYFYDEGAPIHSLAIADVDNDGHTEIIAGGGWEHTGAPGVYTYIIDGTTGSVEWNSVNLDGGTVSELDVANLDGDEELEILAVSERLYVFDPTSNQQRQSAFTGVTSVEVLDIDGDGTDEILAGTYQGQIKGLNSQTLQTEFDLKIGTDAMAALKAYDFDQDGTDELVFGTSNSVGIYSFKQSDVLWQKDIANVVAGSNSLEVSDLDGNGVAEIVVGTHTQVIEFEVPEFQEESSPVLIKPIEDVIAHNADAVKLPINHYFGHPNSSDSLQYRAEGLPSGLLLDTNTGLLSGIPTDLGFHMISVAATDSLGSSISDTFELTVFNFIRSTQQDDREWGTAEADLIQGRNGNDSLYGKSGNDLMYGGRGQDRLIGGWGDDTLNGSIGDDVLIGSRGNDVLVGGPGNDRLIGGKGEDTLKGGRGMDEFVFQKSTHQADSILDFDVTDDSILIQKSGFDLHLAKGVLADARFTIGSSPKDRGDRFIYNEQTGALLFDPDGTRSQDAKAIAFLEPGIELSATNIYLI